jgi:NAD(P)-dependent dehydrogenase (short-subunit alcohol dehydrogenase family)
MPTVLATGAGRGIGKSIVEYLATRGWDVIAGVRTERDAATVTALSPQRITSVILDVTDAGHIAALDESLPERVDAIVNDAGVVVSGPIETVTSEGWRKQLEVNVSASSHSPGPCFRGCSSRAAGWCSSPVSTGGCRCR